MRVNTRDINSTRGTPSFTVSLVYNNNNCTCPRVKPASSTVKCSSWSVTHHINFFNFKCIKTWFIYHWQQLPQVPFLSRQKFCYNKHMFIATKHMFVATKHVFCCNKSMRQNIFVTIKHMIVMTNICHGNHVFVVTSTLLSWQKTPYCHDKHMFVATKVSLSLLWENYVCHNKCFVAIKTCLSWQKFDCDKHILSWQKLCLWQLPPTILICFRCTKRRAEWHN